MKNKNNINKGIKLLDISVYEFIFGSEESGGAAEIY